MKNDMKLSFMLCFFLNLFLYLLCSFMIGVMFILLNVVRIVLVCCDLSRCLVICVCRCDIGMCCFGWLFSYVVVDVGIFIFGSDGFVVVVFVGVVVGVVFGVLFVVSVLFFVMWLLWFEFVMLFVDRFFLVSSFVVVGDVVVEFDVVVVVGWVVGVVVVGVVVGLILVVFVVVLVVFVFVLVLIVVMIWLVMIVLLLFCSICVSMFVVGVGILRMILLVLSLIRILFCVIVLFGFFFYCSMVVFDIDFDSWGILIFMIVMWFFWMFNLGCDEVCVMFLVGVVCYVFGGLKGMGKCCVFFCFVWCWLFCDWCVF